MTAYLILHNVRGEPSFDIAEKVMIGAEEGWILSTCGYRAYPYWHREVSEIIFDQGLSHSCVAPIYLSELIPPMPSTALDCFHSKPPASTTTDDLLAELGLT